MNPLTLETRHPGVFAIGDVASIRLHNGLFLPMAGVFALQEGLVVAANIAAETGVGSPTGYTGEGYCYVEVGYGKAAFGSGNFYASPAPKVTLQPPSEEHKRAKDEFAAMVLRSAKPPAHGR